MSRLFDGSGDRLVGSPPLTAVPLSIAAWVRRAATGTTQYIVNLLADGANVHSHRILFSAGDVPQAASQDAGGTNPAAATTSLTDTASWHHICGVFTSATSRACFLDGGNKGINTTSRTPAGINAIKLGASGTNANVLNGYLAHVAIWSAALTDDEVASLAQGCPPTLIRAASLAAYYPVLGRDATEIDIIGRFDLTVTGTSQSLEEPFTLRRARRRIFIPASAAGQNVDVGQTTETDSAQVVTWTKVRSVGLNTETDSVLTATRAKSKAIGLTTETDEAQTVGHTRAFAVGLNTETDEAQAITRSKSAAVGLNAETDSAQAVTFTKAKEVGLTTETDTAQAVVTGNAVAVGQVEEIDEPFGVSFIKVKAIGLNTETDEAQAIARAKSCAVGLNTETDEAFAAAVLRSLAVGLATEIAEPLALTFFKMRELGLALETDEALPIEAPQRPIDASAYLPVSIEFQTPDRFPVTGTHVKLFDV